MGYAEGIIKILDRNPNHFKEIGTKGGNAPHIRRGGWAVNRELASIAGRLGGTISRRKDGIIRKPVDQGLISKRRKEFDKAYKHLLEVNQKANSNVEA